MDKNKDLSHELLPIMIMGSLFVVIHFFALILVPLFAEAEMQAFGEDINNPLNLIYIFVILLVMTAVILLIAKYWKKQLIQVIILGAIGYTAFWVIWSPLKLVFLWQFAMIISAVIGIILVAVLYKYPEWYVIDICGIIIGAGAIAIFGISLGILLVIILLICLAIYDAISVYKTKHMIDLADAVLDLKLPVLLVVPKKRHYSLIEETKGLKQKIEEQEERDAFFMGLGDIVMPGILVAAVFHFIPNSLPIAISVIIGTLVGFAILMTFVIKGKPQAGLPCLCGGAIAGYVISSLILKGELAGLTLPF
jgi:presenilin-like A22 family membrane protease